MSSNSEIFGKCQKHECGCQIYRLNTDSIDEKCYFCEHGSGFHEILSEINTSVYTLGPCNKDRSCECQRFKQKETDIEKCLYCNHFFAFHESWIQNQTRVQPSSSTVIPSYSNPATLISQMHNGTSSSSSTNNQFTSVRQELLASFRPSLAVSLNDIQGPRNRINNQRQRNTRSNQTAQEITLKLNYLILMDKVDSANIPKIASNLWNNFIDAGLIKLNITLSESNLSHQILDLFPMLTGQEWKIFNASSGKLKDVQNMEKTINFLKNHTTKHPKKLYIGPTERNLTVLSPSNINLEENEPTPSPPADNIQLPSIPSPALSPATLPGLSPALSPTLSNDHHIDDLAFRPASFIDHIEVINIADTSYSTIFDDEQVFENVINEFKSKIIEENPGFISNTINLRRSDEETFFADFIHQIKTWNNSDFIYRPFLRINNEIGVDAGGIFNDTLNKIFEAFLKSTNTNFGGDGSLFVGEFSKTISESVMVEFVDEIKIFGDLLFLTIIHGGPFPNQLNESLIKYCFGYEDNIIIDDLGSLNPIVYRLALDINNSPENIDLSSINGFDEWAENNNIQHNQYSTFSNNSENLKKLSRKIWYNLLVNKRIEQLNCIKQQINKFDFLKFLQSKNITLDIILKYLYNECYLAQDVIEKLRFNSILTNAQLLIKQYLIEWISEKDPTQIGRLCSLITGVNHPRGIIKVNFKHSDNDDLTDLYPVFHTCTQSFDVSSNFESKEQFELVFDNTLDDSFSTFTMI